MPEDVPCIRSSRTKLFVHSKITDVIHEINWITL